MSYLVAAGVMVVYGVVMFGTGFYVRGNIEPYWH